MSVNQAYKTDDSAVENASSPDKNSQPNLETIVNDELDRIGQGGRWVW